LFGISALTAVLTTVIVQIGLQLVKYKFESETEM